MAEPAHVALLRSFLNTRDLEDDSDRLADVPGLRSWLREQGLLDAQQEPTPADVGLALSLRDGLRAAAAAHPDEPGPDHGPLEAAAAALPLRVRFVSGRPALVPVQQGVPGALASVLVALTEAVADGSWDRVKLCAADDCRWSFFDVSKNRSRTWCDMAVCGNRRKSKAYRERRRGTADAG